MDKQQLKILYISSEVAPFMKVGGLADVAESLPPALAKLVGEVQVMMPRYAKMTFRDGAPRKLLPSFTVGSGEKHYFPTVYQSTLGDSAVKINFIEEAEIFGRENLYGYQDDSKRFCFFCKACLECCKAIGFQPDIINCNDWHSALVPVFLKTLYRADPFFQNCRTVLSLHNMQYQGITPLSVLEFAQITPNMLPSLKIDSENNDIDFLLEGILNADAITTVSETYAKEILTAEYGYGLEYFLNQRQANLYGITNGIDQTLWDPAQDPKITVNYDLNTVQEGKRGNKAALQQTMGLPVNERIPVIGLVSRLVEQKGLDLLFAVAEKLFLQEWQLVVLGTGDGKYISLLENLRRRFPGQCSVNLTFDDAMARKIYAGADYFLMPSKFEPCGLSQMFAMRYGTIPIVRATGGLKDTVIAYNNDQDCGDGFVFEHYQPQELFDTMVLAIQKYANPALIERMRRKIMAKDFSWEKSATEYLRVYKTLL